MLKFIQDIKTRIVLALSQEAYELLINRVINYDKKILDLHNRLIQQENLREQYERFVRAHIMNIENRIKLIEESIKTK